MDKNIILLLLGNEIYDYSKGTFSTDGSFVNWAKKRTFIETVGEYSTRSASEIVTELDNGIRNNKSKRVIVYKATK